MPITPSSETIVRTVAEKGKNVPATREEKIVGQAYKDKVKSEGPRSAAETAAARKEKIDEKAAGKTINENIGSADIDISKGTKTRDAAEQDRFDKATSAENSLLEFLKEGKGLTNLNPTEQAAVIGKVRAEMEKWEGMTDLFKDKTAAEQDELIRQWVEDPAFFNKVKDLREARVVNPAEKIGGESREKDNQIKELEQQIEAKTKEVEANQEQQKEQYEIIESFEDHSATGGKQGDNYKRLEEIDTELKTYTPTRLQTLRREKGQLESRIATITKAIEAENTAKKPDAAALGYLRGELVSTQKDLEDRSGQLTDYEDLNSENKDLLQKQKGANDRYKELTSEHIQKTDEINQAQKDMFTLKAEKGMMGTDRAEAETAFVKSIEDIYADALNELWVEQIKTLEDAVFKTYQEEIDNPDANPDRKALLSALESRYQKVQNEHENGRLHLGIGKGEIKTVPDKDKIEKDLEILKKNSNPEENLVRKALAEAINPETKKPYKPAEIDAIFKANRDFGKDNIGTVVKALVAKGLQTRQVSAKDINTFVAKGYVSEGEMIKAISDSQSVKDKLKHAGIKEKAWDELKKNKKLGWWLILFMMFPVGGVAVSAFIAGKHVLAKESAHGEKKDEKKDGEKKDEPEAEEPATPEPKGDIDPALLTPEAKAS